MRLLETLIAMTVLAVVIMLCTQVMGTGMLTYGQCNANSDAALQTTGAMRRVCQDLEAASYGTLSLAAGATATSISFQKITGMTYSTATQSTTSTLGNTITYSFVLADASHYGTAETLNGVDDNGNGLVDEGMLQRQETTQSTTYVCKDLLNTATPQSNGTSWNTTGQQAFLFSRAASPYDNKITVTLTRGIRLNDSTFTMVQLVETVAVRSK